MPHSPDPYERVGYRRLIAWPERLEREGPLLESTLASGPSRRILDLGCGPGEHARALAGRGFEVVGVDRSPAMLRQATAAPLPPGLSFVEGDLTALGAAVEGPFGGALCLGNTLPHLADEETLGRFVRGLAALLSPGAPLVVQTLGYDRILDRRVRALPVSFRPHAGPDGAVDEGAELVFLRLMEPLPDGRVRFFPTTLVLRPGAEPPLAIEQTREVLLRGWRERELVAALATAGFLHERSLASYAGAPYDPAESQDLVLIARRDG